MATHDYVIDNSTGANVRADINNVLAAIVSNNSGSSEPATKYAYQWWADTSAGVLKIRNSANNAWVELLQLDGTLTLEDGSASTPALAFRDDLNTGIFSSAADTFNVATGGVERMELGSATVFNEDGADVDFRIEGDNNANLFYLDAGNDRIGVGISSPEANLHVHTDSNGEGVLIKSTGNTSNALTFDANRGAEGVIAAMYGRWNGTTVAQINFVSGADGTNKDDGAITFGTESAASSGNVNATERMRLDSSGRVGIGTTSPSVLLDLESTAPTIKLTDSDATGTPECEIRGGGGDLVFAADKDGEKDSSKIKFEIDGNIDMVLNHDGQLGIGTENPATLLNCSAASSPTIQINSTGASPAIFSTDSNRTGDGQHLGEFRAHWNGTNVARIVFQAGDDTSNKDNGQIVFSTAAAGSTAERMRIDESGNVLIGQSSTTSPGQGNSTQGISLNGTTSGARIYVSRDGAGALFLNRGSNAGEIQHFYFGGVQKGNISISSSAVAYNTTTSDRATKKNFESWTEDVLALFKNINPQKFNFNFQEDTDPKIKGFIAQDLVASFPEAYNKGDDDLYQFNPSGMVVYLMKAIQELEAKVAVLEAA